MSGIVVVDDERSVLAAFEELLSARGTTWRRRSMPRRRWSARGRAIATW